MSGCSGLSNRRRGWALLTGVLDRAEDHPQVVTARRAVLADPGTRDLLDRLPDWEGGQPLSGHDSPSFAPNLLNLLADMGLRAGDDHRLDRVLRQLLAHQDADGRFMSFAPLRGGAAPVWGGLLCDSHAVVEILVRYGHAADPRVRAGLARIAADLTDTAQGPGLAVPARPGDRVPRPGAPG